MTKTGLDVLKEQIELFKAAHEAVNTLHQRVLDEAIQSSGAEGRLHDGIADGLVFPLMSALQYFDNLSAVVENSEIGNKYNIFRPIKRQKVKDATAVALEVLAHLPDTLLKYVRYRAQKALAADLEGSIAYYARALTDEHAEGTPEERAAQLDPIKKIYNFLSAYHKLRETKHRSYFLGGGLPPLILNKDPSVEPRYMR